MRYMPDDNLSYPVLIKFLDGGSGSGFLLNYDDRLWFLVTAKHVIYRKYINNELILGGKKLTISAKNKNIDIIEPLKIEVDLEKIRILTLDTVDMVLVLLGSLEKENDGGQKVVFYNGVEGSKPDFDFVSVASNNLLSYNDVLISNEIFVLGYPSSIGSGNPQIDYEQPLLRKGIVAGKNYKNKSIILDCPVYQGNSGGLVIQVDQDQGLRKFQILGIVTEFIPFFEVMRSLHHNYENRNIENSGYAVALPSDHILDIIKKANL